MSTNEQPDRFSLLTAEEVLRRIYGDDLTGCTVTLEEIAALVSEAGKARETQSTELLRLYEKVIEIISGISTPPDGATVSTPTELQMLLSERLDAIHKVAGKAMEAGVLVQKQRGKG